MTVKYIYHLRVRGIPIYATAAPEMFRKTSIELRKRMARVIRTLAVPVACKKVARVQRESKGKDDRWQIAHSSERVDYGVSTGISYVRGYRCDCRRARYRPRVDVPVRTTPQNDHIVTRSRVCREPAASLVAYSEGTLRCA